jgi:hypothetical protein
LGLSAASIFVVFPSDHREYVEHHRVDGGEHAAGEFVGRG